MRPVEFDLGSGEFNYRYHGIPPMAESPTTKHSPKYQELAQYSYVSKLYLNPRTNIYLSASYLMEPSHYTSGQMGKK